VQGGRVHGISIDGAGTIQTLFEMAEPGGVILALGLTTDVARAQTVPQEALEQLAS
jgi:hypothetical protein